MSDTTTIEIFRVGTHTAMDGREHSFSREDLQAVADGYDAAVFQAPLVIGHPRTNDPALGWVDALRMDGDVLLAEASQVEPAFAEAVNAGRYKRVSPWFYPPAGRTNPKKGAHYLRHVGFLGAAAPGCQGLAPVAFAEGEDEAELLAFGASTSAMRPFVWMARSLARVLRRQRDAIIAEEGVEAADKQIPEWDIETATDAAARLEAELNEADGPRAYAEGEGQPEAEAGAEAAAEAEVDSADEAAADPAAGPESDPGADPAFAERQAELDAREQALAEREARASQQEAAFAEGERQGRAAEDSAWLDGLVEAGKLPPGHRSDVAAFCALLGEGEAIAFSEGGDPESPRDRFKALMDGLGAVIRFDEIAPGSGAGFAEGQSADDLAAAARQRVAEAAQRGETLSVSSAVAEITAGR